MRRRNFLKTISVVAAGYALDSLPVIASEEANNQKALVLRRVLGKTKECLSIVGFPGLALIHYDQATCTDALHRAFDRGINYFDVAPAYGNGECETKMGKGLQGIKRSNIFLACKTKKRDKAGAQQELENSLKILKTDYFDLYQLHHLVTSEDVRTALGPGGAIEAILKAKEEGKVKYIGFSAHTTKAALEALNKYSFDTVMFPINFVELLNRGFGREVLELAYTKNVPVLAIKPLSRGAWPQNVEQKRKWWYRCMETSEEVSLAMRFSWSQKGVVAAIPPSFLDLLDVAINVSSNTEPLAEKELNFLKDIAKDAGSIFQAEEQRAQTAHLILRHSYPDNVFEPLRC